MKHLFSPVLRVTRITSMLLVALLLLSACAASAPPRGYTYYPSAAYYHSNPVYYGSYRPGWFVAAPYYPGNYWGNGAMVYWPTYASSYYYTNHYYGGGYYYGRYYPYSDPWYYPYGGHNRHVYGHYYGPYNGPYYGYGAGGGWWYRPHSGNSHAYRPPPQHQYERPDPVVIPRDQRGRRGAADDYSDEIAERQRRHESRQPDRRSATVVTERQGVSSSVGVAPGRDGSQGMVISNRNERKVGRSRMHPVDGSGQAQGVSTQDKPVSSNRIPRQPSAAEQPTVRISGGQGHVVTPARPVVEVPGEARSVTGRTDYPAPPEHIPQRIPERFSGATGNSAAISRPEPVYRQQPDSVTVIPRAERGQRRDPERGQDRDRDRRRQ